MSKDFWQTKSLAEMTFDEWEQICDGCAKCCLIKLEDEDDGTVYYTDIACQLLDLEICRCRDYENRQKRVPACIKLEPSAIDDLWMMPPSCSYRRLAEGRGLAPWHHLRSGHPQAVIEEGHAIAGRAVSETSLASGEDLEDHIASWPLT